MGQSQVVQLTAVNCEDRLTCWNEKETVRIEKPSPALEERSEAGKRGTGWKGATSRERTENP